MMFFAKQHFKSYFFSSNIMWFCILLQYSYQQLAMLKNKFPLCDLYEFSHV